MFTLRPHPVRLLVLCWLALAASSTATAKKPPPDDPPPPALAPVLYEVIWLDGLSGYSATYANDVNIDGTIVGTVQNEDCTSRAVRWRFGFENGWVLEDLNDFVSDSLDGGHLSCAECINNEGLIAGCYKDADGVGHVCVCDPDADPDAEDLWILDHDGSFSIRDMNDEGTVVGYVLNEADIKQGFVWNYEKGLLLLPEGYLASGITDSEVVVGIIAGTGGTSGEVFRWQVDWNRPDPAANAERLGALARLFAPYNGRPAISTEGTIAATVAIGRELEPRRLLPGLGQVWELLTEGFNYRGSAAVCDINSQGQICGRLYVKRPPSDFYTGFVYDAHEAEFWVLDDRIVHDATGLWATGNLDGDVLDAGNGPVLPRAVADESVITAHNGFSTIVGWQGTGSFVLVPGPPSE